MIDHEKEPSGTEAEAVGRTQLNARWDHLNARIAAEVRVLGSLPEGDLTEEEIARIAVDMTRDES